MTSSAPLPDPLAVATESLPVLAWAFGDDLSVRWVNAAVVAYFGGDRARFLGGGWTDLIHPDDLEGYSAALRSAKASGSVLYWETRVRRDDGRVDWLSIWTVPTPATADAPAGWMGMGAPLHVPRTPTDATRSNRILVPAALSILREGIVLHGPDGQISFANAAARELLGLDRPQIVGARSTDAIWDVIDADGQPFPGDRHPASEALRTGQPVTGVLMGVRRPDGSRVWISVNALPVADYPEQGQRAVLVSFADVTAMREGAMHRAALAREEAARAVAEQMAARQALLARAGQALAPLASGVTAYEDLLALLVPTLSAAAAIYVSRSDGGLRRVAQAGPATGLPETIAAGAEHPVARAHRAGQRADGAAADATGTSQLQAEPVPVGVEDRAVLVLAAPADGSAVADLAPTLTELAGRLGLAMENARLWQASRDELETRRRAERTLAAERAQLAARIDERTRELSAANVELARASRLKDEFLATMSHELRTPLTGILGSAESLLDGVCGALAPAQAAELRHIQDSGAQLLAIINDILDLSRIAAGRYPIDVAPITPAALLRPALSAIDATAAARGVELELRCPDDAGPLHTDQRAVSQILGNLLSNAVKFTPKGGRVTVSAQPLPGGLRLEVRDTGIGIPADALTRIFQPFTQVQSGLDRTHGGTGLGLALVDRMVRALGGSVTVASVVGVGSTFTVELPDGGASAARSTPSQGVPLPPPVQPPAPPASVVAPAAPAPMPSAEPAATPAARVLIAEDNVANAKTFATYLRARGFEVTWVEDGQAALEACAAAPPDLLVTDIQMPGMDGMALMRALRDDGRFARLPIVAVSALAMPGDAARILEAGADRYLPKPVRLAELTRTIAELLDARAA